MTEDKGQASEGVETAGLDDSAHPKAPTDHPINPVTFLAGLSDALKGTEGVDADLAGILADHLLLAEPHDHAVANAKNAILELASQRATRVGNEQSDVADD